MTTFDAFISYNKVDFAAVSEIAEALNARGLTLFLDRWSLTPGLTWPDALERHLAECQTVIVFVGSSGLGSWQKREIYYALDRQTTRPNLPVIPVLLPDVQDPIPLGFLALNTWIDLREGPEEAELARLSEAIREGTNSETAAYAKKPSSLRDKTCPYRGLDAFREEDAPFFFGRSADSARLIEKLADHALVAVVGPSGSGKSSLVRAGLIPALRQEQDGHVWDILVLRPGTKPIESLMRVLDPPDRTHSLTAARAELDSAVRRVRSNEVSLAAIIADFLERQPGTDRLLLVIDQFEEVETVANDPAEVESFLRLLVEIAEARAQVRIVLTLRSDFFGLISKRRDLRDMVQDAVFAVGPLSRDGQNGQPSELEEVIEKPAQTVGLSFETGLVARILDDVGHEPGNLPLLEYLLMELWRRRVDGVLTHDAYTALGGVGEAITRRAEAFLKGLNSRELESAHRILLSLIRTAEDGTVSRISAPLPQESEDLEIVRRLADPKMRLLVTQADEIDNARIELAHESLIDQWSTLREWIDQNRTDLRVRDRLQERARRWQDLDQPDELLLPSGLELEEGRQLIAGTALADELTERYVAGSAAKEELERQREIDEQRAKRRLVTGALAATLILLLIAGVQWWRAEEANSEARAAAENEKAAAQLAEKEREKAERASERAKREERRAKSQADLANARYLTSVAERTLEENPGETSAAAMIAVDSLKKAVTPEGTGVLRTALSLKPGSIAPADDDWADEVIVAEQGDVAAWLRHDRHGSGTYSSQKEPIQTEVAVLDLNTLETQWTERVDGGAVAALSADGSAAIVGATRHISIKDANGDTVIGPKDVSGDTAAVFSEDGGSLYLFHESGRIEVRTAPDWRVSREISFPRSINSHAIETRLVSNGEALLIAEFGFPESQLVHAHLDGSESWRLPVTFDDLAVDHDNGNPFAIDSAGRFAVSSNNDGVAAIWDLETNAKLSPFRIPEAIWLSARSRVSSTGIVGSAVNSLDSLPSNVVLWSIKKEAEVARWQHDGRVRVLAFSPDGEWLAAGGDAGVSLGRADGDDVIRIFDKETVRSLVFEQVGTLLIGTESGRLLRYDPSAGTTLVERTFDRAIHRIVADRHNGRMAISLGADDRDGRWTDIRITHLLSDRRIAAWSWNDTLLRPALTPDGSTFGAQILQSGEVLIWNVADQRLRRRIPVEGEFAGFDPSGRMLLVSDRKLALYSLDTGQRLGELGEPGGVYEVYWSDDGLTATTQGLEGDLAGWDLSSGEMLWRVEKTTSSLSGWRSEDGRLEARHDGEHLRIVNARTGKVSAFLKMPQPNAAVISNDAARLLVGHPAGDEISHNRGKRTRLDLWDVAKRKVVWSEEMDTSVALTAELAVLPNGDFVAHGTGSVDRTVKHWMRYLPAGAEGAWTSDRETSQAFKHMATDDDFVLLSAYRAIEMRDRKTGDLLWRRERSLPVSGRLHGSFFPDGQNVAIVESEHGEPAPNLVRVYDVYSGQERFRRAGTGLTNDVTVSSDGETLIVGIETDVGGKLSVINIANGQEQRQIPFPIDFFEVKALPGDTRVAVHDRSFLFEIWDFQSGSFLMRFPMSVTADGFAHALRAQRALTVSGGSLRVWDTEAREQVAARAAEGEISRPAISADGSRVAYFSKRPNAGSAVMLWEPGSDAEPRSIFSETARKLRFSPNGEHLVIDEGPRRVRLVDVATLATKFPVPALRNGEIKNTAFSGDGKFLLLIETGTYSGRGMQSRRTALRAHEIASGKEVARLDVGRETVVTVPGTADIIFSGIDYRLRRLRLPGTPLDERRSVGADLLKTATQSPVTLVSSSQGSTRVFNVLDKDEVTLTTGEEDFNVLAADLSPDGDFALLSLRERDWLPESPGEIVIHDTASGQPVARLSRDRHFSNAVLTGDIALLSELRNHKVDEPEHEFVWWNWRTGETRTLVSDNPVTDIVVSPDGREFASAEGSLSGTGENRRVVGRQQVRVWDVATGAERLRIPTNYAFAKLVFSPDHQFLAIAEKASAQLIDLKSGNVVLTIGPAQEKRQDGTPHIVDDIVNNRVNWMWPGFADDGETLVVVTQRDVILRDLSSEQPERLSETDEIKGAIFSADGRFLALNTGENAHIWDLENRALIAELPIAENSQLAFAGADDARLIASNREDTIRLAWQPSELIKRACQAFALDDWHLSRLRLAGPDDQGPCDAETQH